MNVYDILVESKKLDEANPLDYIARAAGSKTASTKIAQDKEIKKLVKDFEAFYRGSRSGKPTTQLLYKFLSQDAELPISSEQEIIKAMRANPSTARSLGRMGQKAGQAIKKGAQAIKKAAQGPAPVGGNSNSKQGELDLQSMYESIQEAVLKPSDVSNIIQYFVKKGFEQGGTGTGPSIYAAKPQAKKNPQNQQTKTKQGIRTTAQQMGSKTSADRTAKGMEKLVKGEAIPASLAKELAPFVEPLMAIMTEPQKRNRFIQMVKQLEKEEA